jgi:hypothetical protein
MPLLVNETSLNLWHEVVLAAENRCSIVLSGDLESYLISLLMRYSNKPEVAQQLFAKAYLQALEKQHCQRKVLLQDVGDQCLLYAGLFPAQAEKRNVKITYFVNLGRSAYATVSNTAYDLYWGLASQFVALMDVLQCIREPQTLLPLQAYEQWNELGSQHALRILKNYTRGIPIKK